MDVLIDPDVKIAEIDIYFNANLPEILLLLLDGSEDDENDLDDSHQS